MKYNKFNLGNRKAVKKKELDKKQINQLLVSMNYVFTVQNNTGGMGQPHFCFHVYMGRWNLTHTPPPPQHAKYRLCLCMGKEGLQMNITFPAGPDLANLSLAGSGAMV